MSDRVYHLWSMDSSLTRFLPERNFDYWEMSELPAWFAATLHEEDGKIEEIVIGSDEGGIVFKPVGRFDHLNEKPDEQD